MPIQLFTGNVAPATQFKGPVTIINGGLDGLMCPPPCDPVAFKEEQIPFFPNADLSVVRFVLWTPRVPSIPNVNNGQIIIPGQGHDLNLEFGAAMAFRSMINLFKKATH